MEELIKKYQVNIIVMMGGRAGELAIIYSIKGNL